MKTKFNGGAARTVNPLMPRIPRIESRRFITMVLDFCIQHALAPKLHLSAQFRASFPSSSLGTHLGAKLCFAGGGIRGWDREQTSAGTCADSRDSKTLSNLPIEPDERLRLGHSSELAHAG